jgi:hypothetical protein
MSKERNPQPQFLTVVAGDTLYSSGIALAGTLGIDRVNHLFPQLFERLSGLREEWDWHAASATVFVAAVDQRSDRQGGLLVRAAEAGAMVDAVDYRDYFPSPAPGAQPTVIAAGAVASDEASDAPWRPRPTLAPRLSFLLGGLAAKQSMGHRSEVLVLAHHFELKDALLELLQRGAMVGLCGYRSMMDLRWERFGLFDAKSPIRFHDLGADFDLITSAGQRKHSSGANISAPSKLF